jgi:hypothetical protein
MTPAIIATILGILEKYGPIAYQAAVNLFHKQDPSKADFLAVSDAALTGSYVEDLLAARDRYDKAAGTGAFAGATPAKKP